MSFKPAFQAAIERHYNLKIKQATPGPRQFVAETYILDCEDGEQYFCKIVDKPLFMPDIIAGLPAVEEMKNLGVDRISYPIRGRPGLHFFLDDRLIFLMNYIPAPQSYDYSLFAFGKLTAQIHAVSGKMQIPVPTECFAFPDRELFDERLERGLKAVVDDPVLSEFQKVLKRNEGNIRQLIEEFNRLAKICGKKIRPLVLTHGDAPGNVLMKSFDDIYIIDWDELMLAPPERDIWMVDHHPEFMEGYRSVLPDFAPDMDMRSFCMLRYYFRTTMHYFSEILKDSLYADERLDYLKKYEEEITTGWMMPKLEGILRLKCPLRIRMFQPEDIDDIQRIRRKAFCPVHESFRKILGDELFVLNFGQWDREQATYLESICKSDSGKEIYVVTIDRKVVAFIGLSLDKEKIKGEIDLNAVDPDAQGKGIGAFMYEFVLQRMRDEGMRFACVSTGGDPSHAPARRAYEKAGFGPAIPSVNMFVRL